MTMLNLLQSVLAGLSISLSVGCNSTESTSAAPADANGSAQVAPGATTDEVLRKLEQDYLIGPVSAQSLGLRIDWQSLVGQQTGSKLSHFWVLGDSVVVLDESQMLTRLRLKDGGAVWRSPMGGQMGRILGISRMVGESGDGLFLTTDTELFVVDAANGAPLRRQRFEKIASTPSTVWDRFVVYGSHNGQVVWHQYLAGVAYGANQLNGAITVKPLLVGNDIVAVSLKGTVMVLDARSTHSIWAKQLLDGVVASPAASDGIVYVAGLDQYLWALDIRNGRTRWKYLTVSPLRDAPVVIGSHVYQQIPGKGLACLEANPADSPGGKLLWEASTVSGSVVTTVGSNLLVWDSRKKVMWLVDIRGNVVSEVGVPDVDQAWCDSLENGELFVSGDDGRVSHLKVVGR